MFDREFGFLNRLLVAPLRGRSSIVLASVIYITTLSLVQSLAIMITAFLLGLRMAGCCGVCCSGHPVAACVRGHRSQSWSWPSPCLGILS